MKKMKFLKKWTAMLVALAMFLGIGNAALAQDEEYVEELEEETIEEEIIEEEPVEEDFIEEEPVEEEPVEEEPVEEEIVEEEPVEEEPVEEEPVEEEPVDEEIVDEEPVGEENLGEEILDQEIPMGTISEADMLQILENANIEKKNLMGTLEPETNLGKNEKEIVEQTANIIITSASAAKKEHIQRDVSICANGNTFSAGEEVVLEAVLHGFENCQYTISWQYNDGNGWTKAWGESDQEVYAYTIDASNSNYQWSVIVTIL